MGFCCRYDGEGGTTVKTSYLAFLRTRNRKLADRHRNGNGLYFYFQKKKKHFLLTDLPENGFQTVIMYMRNMYVYIYIYIYSELLLLKLNT